MSDNGHVRDSGSIGIDCLLRETPDRLVEEARTLDVLGADGYWIPEVATDPFVSMAIVAEHTRDCRVGSAVAVALARSPMQLAYQAASVERLAPGRLVLGLGTQTRQHLKYRFGMPYSDPVCRMEDYVGALRAIWARWTGTRELAYRGSYYRHTLMPDFFVPTVRPGSALNIYLGAVGRRMCRLAGRVAEGVICHPFATAQYVQNQVIPALSEGRKGAGLSGQQMEIVVNPVLVMGDDQEVDVGWEEARYQVAFFAATSEYLPILREHDLEWLHTDCRQFMLRSKPEDLTRVVPDELLEIFAMRGSAHQIPSLVVERYSGLASRIAISLSKSAWQRPATWRRMFMECRDAFRVRTVVDADERDHLTQGPANSRKELD